MLQYDLCHKVFSSSGMLFHCFLLKEGEEKNPHILFQIKIVPVVKGAIMDA